MPASLEQRIEKEYHVSWFIIAYKFAYGLVEVLLGGGFILFGRNAFLWYRAYVAGELSEDPHDLVIRLSESIVPNLLTHNVLLSVYLIILGATKIAGAVGLLFNQDWGVDLLFGVTVIMFPFQFFQLLRHPSVTDFLYIFIGLFIALYLVNFRPHEWAKRVSRRIHNR